MKSTNKLLLVLLLLMMGIGAKAGVEETRVFRTITASDGLADNSAQTMKCTFTGRMTITTLGNINYYDGANFSHINRSQERIYKLENYHGHYHLYYDRYHHLWLKSSQGVTCVNLSTERHINNIDSVFRMFGAKGRIDDMFVDRYGEVWLCSNDSVFNVKYRKRVSLRKGVNLQDLEVYDRSQLMLFYEDGLLACYDLKAGRKLYQNYAYGQEDSGKFRRSGVQTIYKDNVYMIRNGAQEAILMRYNIKDRQWSEVMRKGFHLNNLVVHNDILYISSAYGYFTYDLNTGDIEHQETLTLRSGRNLLTDINVIEFDQQGGMWIGTEKRGLLYAPPQDAPFQVLGWEDERAKNYWAMMENLTGVSEFRGQKANVMLLDSRNWTWVGTSNGLYLYTTPQTEPIVFSSRNGLLNSVIQSVIEDDMHNIWLSSSYGISCIHIVGGKVKEVFCFSTNDNVPNETFIKAKAMKLPDGKIVMQALDHVVVFDPKDFSSLLDQEPYQMHPKLTKLLVNGIDVTAGDKVNGEVVLDKAITRTKEINLNYDQNSLSLTFSALNFARPMHTYYRVRIPEISSQWTEYSYFNSNGIVDRRGLLHLPMLAIKPGTYHVELLASVVPGQYVGEPQKWVIHVNQPWWRTTGILMLLGVVVLAMGVLNFIIFNRNTRLKMRRNSEEGDVIRRIRGFVDRCDSFSSELLAPTQEEIYGTDNESQIELNADFVEVMLKIIPFVRERGSRPFSMNMLSNVTDMDLLELYEMVSENIHKSPRVLVRSMRVDKVAEMLRTTDLSIDAIAEECGFVSPNYMIAKFYHKFKMTPREYREELE